MNCTEVNVILDRMVFEEIPEDAALLQHLDICPLCTRAYADALEARSVMNLVRRSEPLLRDPDGLTSYIMDALPGRQAKTMVFPLVLMRLLAAATVALFLLFGYEQYGMVKKIHTLEKQCTGITKDSPYPDLRQLVSTRNISQAGISFAGIERPVKRSKAGSK